MELFFGGNIDLFKGLLLLIILDYISALFVAIYYKKISSSIGYRGIIKKMSILICISLAHQIDSMKLYNSDIPIEKIVVLFFSLNEAISIIENVSKLKIDIPPALKQLISQIKSEK